MIWGERPYVLGRPEGKLEAPRGDRTGGRVGRASALAGGAWRSTRVSSVCFASSKAPPLAPPLHKPNSKVLAHRPKTRLPKLTPLPRHRRRALQVPPPPLLPRSRRPCRTPRRARAPRGVADVAARALCASLRPAQGVRPGGVTSARAGAERQPPALRSAAQVAAAACLLLSD